MGDPLARDVGRRSTRLGKNVVGTSDAPSPTSWIVGPASLAIPREEVHVWRITLRVSGDDRQRLWSTLSSDERQRAAAFVFEADRDRFIAGRGAQRDILSRYLHFSPASLGFHYTTQGKPSIGTPPASLIRFNVSNSGDWALIAVTGSREVAVDLEAVRPMSDLRSIVRQFFSTSECDAFDALAPDAHLSAFLKCWTRKEAYVKAIGDGLSAPLDGFAVALGPGDPARLLWVRDKPEELERWHMADIDLDEGYVAALIVEGRHWTLKHFEWQPPPHLTADKPLVLHMP